MKLCTNYKKMFENIVILGIEYLENHPDIKSMILGISGGIDSALTAAIGREICDQTSKHKLIGVSIPIESNKESEIETAKLIGESLCHKFVEVKFINTLFTIFKLGIEVFYTNKYHSKKLEERIRYGNIKARLRMIYLYDKAHRSNGLVLSTDNLSEFNLGFWTLHGDVGDLGFIQQLWKTEVYGLSKYLLKKYKMSFDTATTYDNLTLYTKRLLAFNDAIGAIPTDGLGVTASDFDQLGVNSYEEVDNILIKYLNGDRTLKSHPLIKRHLKTVYKRENPFNILRKDIVC